MRAIYTCEQFSKLVSRSLDERLSLITRLKMRLHLSLCNTMCPTRCCSGFCDQMHSIRDIADKSGALEIFPRAQLPEAVKIELKEKLKQYS